MYQNKGAGNETVVADLSSSLVNSKNQSYLIQFTVFNAGGAETVPSGGSCVVEAGINPGSTAVVEVENSPIDMTDADYWLTYIPDSCLSRMEFTMTSLDSGYTWDVYVKPVA